MNHILVLDYPLDRSAAVPTARGLGLVSHGHGGRPGQPAFREVPKLSSQ